MLAAVCIKAMVLSCVPQFWLLTDFRRFYEHRHDVFQCFLNLHDWYSAEMMIIVDDREWQAPLSPDAIS